uniref:Uncharacterized protein n=1 Tax=Phenylobacterium glaciei TaxID=2803784 RepID=A0A974P3T5_9CAUL|nr:hypothetical protein JKL49_24730 [Phenylobacterium glaciei]
MRPRHRGLHRRGGEARTDPDRIVELRAGLRERMRASPIGQTTQFAHDFFGLVEKAVKEKA